jgi:hypothetical protein
MARLGRRAFPYAVVVAEYLLAAALLYSGARALTPPPYTCADSCRGLSSLQGLIAIAGGSTLSVGLVVALVIVAVRDGRARQANRVLSRGARAGAATLAAATGVLWGLLALPALCVGGIAGLQLLS